MTNQSIDIIEAQIRECYGRVVWTHKTQEKCADILVHNNKWFKWIQIILASLTTSGLMATLFGECKIVELITTICSVILLCINTYLKDYDLGGLAQKHSNAATELWNIRESYLSLLTDINTGSVDISYVRTKRDELQQKLKDIYKGAPRTITKAYKKACQALKQNEEMTFSNEEINILLPEKLRK